MNVPYCTLIKKLKNIVQEEQNDTNSRHDANRVIVLKNAVHFLVLSEQKETADYLKTKTVPIEMRSFFRKRFYAKDKKQLETAGELIKIVGEMRKNFKKTSHLEKPYEIVAENMLMIREAARRIGQFEVF